MYARRLLLVVALCPLCRPAVGQAQTAELVLPQQRTAYYSAEPIELAVAGLAKDAAETLELVPKAASLATVSLPVKGTGSTVTLVLPPMTLAPGSYTIMLGGKSAGKLTIAAGVRDSTCLVSQTARRDQVGPGGGNFLVGNAASFGRLTAGSPAVAKLRSLRSGGMQSLEQAIEQDLPNLVYMYWTGYVTHKPFGSQKSWASADEQYAMRLLNFHTAQRVRRFHANVLCVGTIDEPGLAWGKTPAGGMASGFPNWDEQPWYEARGWRFTDDPASRPDDDWMKYMTIRCAILKESFARAAKDLKTVWPDMVFSTDVYAPQAIMDGADPLNQQVNDVPCTHVFCDWGLDRLGVYSGLMLEKAHHPTAKVAHAMNGQLFGKRVPQPAQTHACRVCLNGMLAAGLESNWWLNTGGMKPEDLASVNTPARRIGPVLREMTTAGRDVAVLWSFTELVMREKEMSAKEAKKQAGQDITLTVKNLPRNSAVQEREIKINAYSVGQDYKESVLTAHYALSRAGYPAHIVHERILPSGILKNYKTLVIVGQTHALPAEAMQAIRAFAASGGKIVVDQATTVPLEGAAVAALNLAGLSYRWGPLFTQDPKTFKSLREASYFQTNHFMDEPVRGAVGPLKAAMQKTASVARAQTDSDELVIERHLGGEAELYLLVNGYEELPKTSDDEAYPLYNYAAQQAKFSLRGLPERCVVYFLEGTDWSKTGKLADPRAAIDGRFEPGEMKLYLVVPREPAGLRLTASLAGGAIDCAVALDGLRCPWPLTVKVQNPSGDSLYEVWRSTGADGAWRERFPLGGNAPAGAYTIQVSSPLGGMTARAQVQYGPAAPAPQILAETVRAFDAAAIRALLASKPKLVIALGNDAHRAAADRLVAGLSAQGIQAVVKPESSVLRKVRYPRVWNPSLPVYRAKGSQQSMEGKVVDRQVELSIDAEGVTVAKSSDGKDLSRGWREPRSLVTIAGDGFLDWSGDNEAAYERGVKLYVNEKRRVEVIRGIATVEKTTPEVRSRWSRPWATLGTHVGGFQLPAQLPEAYAAEDHLILLGDSTTSGAVAALQASDLLLQVVDAAYPGPGKALVSYAWSPFAVEKDVILVGAADEAGLAAGTARLVELAR